MCAPLCFCDLVRWDKATGVYINTDYGCFCLYIIANTKRGKNIARSNAPRAIYG